MTSISGIAANGDSRLQPAWEDGEHAYFRGDREYPDGTRRPVLAVVAHDGPPTAASLHRFRHEFGLRDELDATWAVRPLELMRDQGRTILVLQDPGGEPLDRLLDRPMDLARFLPLAAAIAAALGGVHGRGLVHKDIKPTNILVDRATGQVRLTGFGVSSRLPRERQEPDAPETIAGTLAYMAPEQTGRMNRSIDSRSDLYSLGVTFYQMLTGTLPFAASDPMELVHCHIARPPVLQAATAPAPVLGILMKLLAKNAEDRYQTAAGVEADLRTCLSQLQTQGRLEAFALGAHDASDRLLIPEKLYGRDAEIDGLLTAFNRVVAEGTTQLVLISGYAGIGKSSIVNELHKALVSPRGLFAGGKFDQYKRDIPYATLAQAFQSLVRQLLGKSEAEVEQWRQALLEALGTNGELMVNLIPELTLIIGEQSPVPQLPPQEGQNRFQRVFRRFLGVFARPEHPLALFLDDLQWLDTATLELLQHLATHPEVRHLLLVGAYRDNEVGPAHPLRRILAAIGDAGGSVQETILSPLLAEDVEQFVADTLHCGREAARPLAALVHDKTDGNPFFAIQFLTALADEGLLWFDRGQAAWSWDLSRILAKGFTENVAGLMAAKLTRLSDDTRSTLGLFACLGNVASFATLALVRGGSEEQVHAELWEAVLAGLVFRVDGAYRFLHDRVQEAAYELIAEPDRPPTHLRIGRILAAHARPEDLGDEVFNIVNHLNRAADLVREPEERERLVTLNLIAGRRAKGSTAYASARNYLAQAIALLAPDAWQQRYEETFDLFLLLSECEYLAGNFAVADTLFETILDRALSDVDKAKVWSLRVKLYQVAGKYDEGLAVVREALSHFGVTFPDTDEDINLAIAAQFREVPVNLNGRPIAALLHAPVAVEPVTRAIIDLLVDAAPCAYIARPQYFPLVTLEAVNRSMRHGNTDQSSYAYGVYAVMVVSIVGDISSAFQFSEMSLRLNEKFDNPRLKGTLLHLHGDHVNFWRRHFATGLPILEQAFNACLDVGDLVYAGFLAFETVWQVIEKGDPLEDVLALSDRYAAFTRQSHNDAVYETIRMEQRFVASLQGLTRDPLNFDDAAFDEAASLEAIQKAAFGCGVVFHHIMKLILGVLFGRYGEAMDAAARAEPVLGAAMAMPSEATYHFYLALAMTALYPDATAAEQETYRRRLAQIMPKLELWAENSPENYRNRHALVAAELARIDGRELEAMQLYEAAIRSAHEGSFLQNEALANELAGRFCLGLGLDAAGLAYLRGARDCFAAWGAAGKVKQLESRYPRIAVAETYQPVRAAGAQAEQFDAATVVKASQALSGEILMPRLIERLMTIALQNAGADRGLLILPHEGDYRVEAEALVSGADVVLRGGPTAGPAAPEAIVRYVIRTHERVILDDATKPNLFSEDAYLAEHQPRSVLCLPLVRQGTLGGLLYLENTLASHVFTPDRAALLELLASQAAISLENTRLYADLQEREARVRRLVDSNIIGIFIWDFEGRIIETNDAFLRMVDRSRGDVVSGVMRWTDLTPPEWREQDARSVAELQAIGRMETVEKEFFRPDGSRVPVLLGAATFGERTDQGVAFVIDLSDRKRAEDEVRESERRYGEIQMELAHANRVATMGQLSASIAHEVNQPITAAVTNAEAGLRWLRRDPPNLDEVRMTLEHIAKDANRASDVIGRIRAMVRKAPQLKEGLEINEAIREVIALARGELAKSGVSVATDLADDLPRIDGDRVQLQQVLLNLMINGIEAMGTVEPGSRRLLIRSARAEPDALVVAVHDTGTGLDPADVERVFEAFYTTKPGGLGMGLSICRSIVEAHGGHLGAGANPPRGTVFQFTLPAQGNGA